MSDWTEHPDPAVREARRAHDAEVAAALADYPDVFPRGAEHVAGWWVRAEAVREVAEVVRATGVDPAGPYREDPAAEADDDPVGVLLSVVTEPAGLGPEDLEWPDAPTTDAGWDALAERLTWPAWLWASTAAEAVALADAVRTHRGGA